MTQTKTNESRPARGGSRDAISFADSMQTTKIPEEVQAEIPCNRVAVAAAIKRAKQRQLDQARHQTGVSLAHKHDGARLPRFTVVALEETEYDAVFDSAKPFIEHARAVAKLANDFESERQAGAARQQEGAP
jgi:hypothetical protein